MNVLALVTDCYGSYGGIAQYNQDFLAALAQSATAPALLVLPRVAPDPYPAPPAGIRQLAPSHGRLSYSLRAIWAALRFRPDLIFCGHLYHGPLARIAARLSGARLIVQLHGTEAWEALPPRLLEPLRQADRVLCVSADTRARIVAQDAALASTAAVLHNTVDPRFTPGDRSAARDSFGLDREFVLLSVGRLDDTLDGYKGHDRIIPLLRAQSAGDRPLRYLVAGKGPDLERLQRLCVEHDVADRVTFLGDVPAARLPDLYRAADLFVLPSTGEGFGIVFIEAMACGTPALGLAVGGAPDALCDGELGMAADPADFPAALARAIEAATGYGSAQRATLSSAVHRKFGRDAFNRKTNAILEPLLA